MILKFVFKNEIHRCSKLPADFASLLQALKQIFKDNLPEFFTLQYDDSDGDKIMLTSNEDYKTMLGNDMNSSQASVKIYITPSEKNNSVGNLTIKADDSFTKIQEPEVKAEPKVEEIKPKVEEVKVEEPLPVEIKQPVVEEQIPEKKDAFEVALVNAEEALKNFNVEPELEAKVNALVLKAFRSQLDLVAGAVRGNIIKSQENVNPATPEGFVDVLVYVQKLAHGVEGVLPEQVQKINSALTTAIDEVKSIQEKKAQEKAAKEKAAKEEVKQPEPEIKKPEPLNGEFVKEVSQLPVEITEKDLNLYKTIVVKNTGKETYPAKTFLECVTSQENTRITVPQIQPGNEFTTVLIISSPQKPGVHSATWAFKVEKPDGTTDEFGKRFDVSYEIKGEKKPEPKEVVYPKEIKEKAISIKEVFPQYSIDDICEYIAKTPNKTLDELFNEYMSIHNSISS